MTRFPAGTVGRADEDPTNEHDWRPVVVLSNEHHPFGGVDCAVMCAGTSAVDYAHPTPELKDSYIEGYSFPERTYLMPWALYTIPPAVISETQTGQLTEEGERVVKKAFLQLFALD